MTDIEDQSYFSDHVATFGDRLAAGREAVGLSQADLAKRLGVKLRTLKDWEEDQADPRSNKLQMVAGVLNVSIVWLLTGEGQGLAGPTDEEALDQDSQSLLIELRQTQMEMQRLVSRMGRLEKRIGKALAST